MVDLSTVFLGKHFANPLMNASGVWCYDAKNLDALKTAQTGALITKSCTLAARAGNPEPRYQATPLGSINSMGLPNLGYTYYLEYARQYGANGKPLFFSLAGLTLEENVSIARALGEAELATVLELNLSCPNIPGKPQIAYDFEAFEHTLTQVEKVYHKPFGVKLPPYFDLVHFDLVAEILNRHAQVAFVTCINSIGNALVIDTESESVIIKPKGGFGGLGGAYVLPTALANVHAFFQRCPDKKIIGCGGVSSGEHVFQHILAGASLVQIGTALQEQGPAIFARLRRELQVLMQSKGYQSLSEFHGRLRTLA